MKCCRTVGQLGWPEMYTLGMTGNEKNCSGGASSGRFKARKLEELKNIDGTLERASVFLCVVVQGQLVCNRVGIMDHEQGRSLGLVIMFFLREKLLKFTLLF